MRARWVAAPVVLFLLAACGGGSGTAAKVQTNTPKVDDLANAVDIAQMSLPVTLPDAQVGSLIKGLCTAAASGDPAPVAADVQGLALSDPAQQHATLDALSAAGDVYCPQDVDPVVPQVESALAAPAAPATATAPNTASAQGTTGSAGSSSSSHANVGGSSGGSTSHSSGSAAVGSGNANGTGNQSGTDFTQSVGSSGSSNSASAGATTSTTS